MAGVQTTEGGRSKGLPFFYVNNPVEKKNIYFYLRIPNNQYICCIIPPWSLPYQSEQEAEVCPPLIG